MFVVLNFAQPCPGFFASRAQKNYFRRCEPERIKPEGGLPFFVMPVLNGKRGVDWRPVREKLGKCASRVVAPRDIALPDSMGFKRYAPRRLIPSLVFNTALAAVSGCGEEIRQRGVTVTDRLALLTGSVTALLPYVSRLRVITACPEKYAHCAENAMQSFGASLIICESGGNIIEDDIIICADSVLPAVRAAAVFSQAKQARGCMSVTGSGIRLGGELLRVLPESVDALDFAGALAELCGVSALLDETFETVYIGGIKSDLFELPGRLLQALERR